MMTSQQPDHTDPLDALTPVDTGEWNPGRVLMHNFRVERILGEGGMGKVYLLYSESSDEYLAVKTLRRSVLNRSRSKRLFIRELRTWIDLPAHPNITACRFFRTIDDRMAVFSEYVEGGALNDWIRQQNGYPLITALDIAIQIARGIDAAHKQQVIHQDIKPSNVLLTVDGVAKITDFGLARARHETGLPEEFETGGTQDTILISSGGMTPAFCSPEQAEKGRISRKTDIWSYGLTVLQLFTGRIIWRLGCMAPEILNQHLDVKPVYPYPDMPAGVEAVLRKCFQTDPRDRWTHCGQIAEALESVYERVSGCPYFRPVPEPLRRIRRRSGHRTGSSSTACRHWQPPDKWIDRLKAAADPDPINTAHWVSDMHGTLKTRALNDLEIYEDIAALYVEWIKKGHCDRIIELAELLADKAEIHEFLDDFEGAVDQYGKITRLLIRNRERVVTPENTHRLVAAFRRMASVYLIQRKSARSIQCCRAALKILDAASISAEGSGSVPERARIQVIMGNAQYIRENYEDTLEACDRAEKILAGYVHNNPDEAQVLFLCLLYRSRANALKMRHQDDDALAELNRALSVYDALDKCVMTPKIKRDKAATHMNLANLLNRMGEREACLENHDRSIAIREELIPVMGWEVIAGDLSLEYMNKAVSLQSVRRAEEALQLLDKALAMKKEIVIYHGRYELENDLSWLYMNKAIILCQLDRKKEAVGLLERAVEIKERIYRRRRGEEMAQQLGMVYTNMAIILQDIDDLDSALAHYEKAIAIRENLYFEKGRTELALPLANLYSSKASLLFLRDEIDEGIQLSEKAIDILEPLVRNDPGPIPREYLAMAYGNKAGGILKRAPDSPDGWKTHHRAREIIDDLVLKEKRYETFFRLANIRMRGIQALAAQKKWTAARAEGNRLLADLDACRADAPADHLDDLRKELESEILKWIPAES